jgi:FkbM family methyltransferase
MDKAHYLAWSRTWEASARQSPLRLRQVEHRLIEVWRTLCRRIEPTMTLEIGAHEATFSRWVAETFPAARVMAFEANPHVHEKYAAELAGTRVDYRNLAVGPVTGEVTLNLPTDIGGKERELTSRMASLGIHTESGDNVQVTVPSVRLEDHVAPSGDDAVVAWIDVEGANEPVLTGAGSVLDRVKAVFIEVEKRTTWEGQWLDTDVAHFLAGYDMVPIVRDLQKPYQYNVIYVRSPLVHQPKVMRKAAEILLPE